MIGSCVLRVEELTACVRHAPDLDDLPAREDRVVDRVRIGLQVASVLAEHPLGTFSTAAGREVEHDIAGVLAKVGPEVRSLAALRTLLRQQGHAGVVGADVARGQDGRLHRSHDRAHELMPVPHPIDERRLWQVDALPLVDPRLAVER